MFALRVRSIQVNLTEHCNLRCVALQSASPHLAAKFADFEQVKADLSHLR